MSHVLYESTVLFSDRTILKIKFPLYCISNQKFAGNLVITWAHHVFWRGDWSLRLHIDLVLPLFSSSSIPRNSSTTAATPSPEFFANAISFPEQLHAPIISSRTVKRSSLLKVSCQSSSGVMQRVSVRRLTSLTLPSLRERLLEPNRHLLRASKAAG